MLCIAIIMGEGQISSGMGGTATLIKFSSLCWAFGNITICGLPMRTLVMFRSRNVSDTEEKHVCVLKGGVSWPPALPEFPEPLPAVGFTEAKISVRAREAFCEGAL